MSLLAEGEFDRPCWFRDTDCHFALLEEFPGFAAALTFVLSVIDSTERKDEMEATKRHYGLSIERFDFFRALYHLPHNSMTEPLSERVPFRDSLHAFRICQFVANAANNDDAATAPLAPKAVAMTPASGGKWTKRV